ncbi:MAG: GTPase HflX, partial [Gammaproteobacteria bacterium]|nr:GTPase HflX [Gammaproteobacteria bacterium]MYK27813.1 GTPase HflX [Gammaproteobacteria bacterium]
AQRARTFEGQLQVELAQLTHAQTQLVGGWSHLERQRGGIGLRGGAGETQLELDQRMLATRIKSVQSRLAGVRKRRGQGQRQRRRSGAQTVALVGYTNAGKSTLFNALATAGVAAEDKLFATLDPTLRRIDVPGAAQVVLADTVGFISHLPHTLIDAFKATLEEVSQADLLIHVMDGAAPRLDQRIADVEAVLEEIGASACARINVLNKCDLPQAEPAPPDALSVSAATGEGLDALRSRIGSALGVQAPIEVDLPASAGGVRAWLYAADAVLGETHTSDGGMRLKVRGDERLMARLRRDLAACA